MGHGQSSVRDWEREAAAWRARAESLQAKVDRLRSLAAAGESAGFLAHELNNLLTPVVGYCQAASADGASDELRNKALKRALIASERVGELSRAILGLSGSAAAEPDDVTWCDVIEPVTSALMVLGVERWKREGIEVRVDVPRGTLVSAPACVVQQVVMNLVLNARRAMAGRRGAIEVVCGAVGGTAWVEVRDQGQGMSVDVIDRLSGITIIDENQKAKVQSSKFKVQVEAVESEGDGGPLPDERGSGAGHGLELTGGSDAQRYEVDVQELARSGSINGQARWGVRLRESVKAPNARLPKSEGGAVSSRGGGDAPARANSRGDAKPLPLVPASSVAARKKQEKVIERLRGGKIAASASPIKIWDAGEVARELRSASAEPPASGASHAEHGCRSDVAKLRGGSIGGVTSGESGGDHAPAAGDSCSLGGSGLGLALCVELATKFGGRMSARSVAGEGTTVVVELPAVQARGKRAA